MGNLKSNDVFLQDRMYRDESDYHGSGIGTGRFDRKRTVSEYMTGAKAGMIFTLICAGLLIFTICLHIADIKLKTQAQSITLPYTEGSWTVNTNDGSQYRTLFFDSLSERSDGQITFYYYNNDIGSAKTVTTIWFYVIMYIAWGTGTVLFAIYTWNKIKQILRAKKMPEHVQDAQ